MDTYDLHTINGIIPGQVTPQAQFEAQRRDAVRRAHREALEMSMGDGGSRQSTGDGGGDFFERELGTYDPYPKNGGMVSGTKPVLQGGDYGTEEYFQARQRDRDNTALNSARTQFETDDLQMRGNMRKKKAIEKGWLPGAQGATPGAAGGNALVGGGVNAPAEGGAAPATGGRYDGMMGSPPAMGGQADSGGLSDEALMDRALEYSFMTGQPLDVGGMLKDREQARIDQPQKDIEISSMRHELEALRRDKERERQAQEMGRDPNMRIEDFVASNPNLSSALTTGVKEYGDRDTDTFGWDPTEEDLERMVREYENYVQILRGRQYPEDQARSQAGQLVLREAAPYIRDLNAGWLKALLVRLGLRAPDPVSTEPVQEVYGP